MHGSCIMMIYNYYRIIFVPIMPTIVWIRAPGFHTAHALTGREGVAPGKQWRGLQALQRTCCPARSV